MTARTRAWMAAAVVILFWGTAYTAVRLALGSFGPGELAAGRFLVAAATVIGLTFATGRNAVPPPAALRKELLLVTLVGVTAYHLLLNFGQLRVAPGTTALILQLAPVFTTLLVWRLGREEVSRWTWLGIAIAFAGTSVIVAGQGKELEVRLSALMIVGCALTTSMHFVFQRNLVSLLGSWRFSTWSMIVAAGTLLPFSPGLFRELAGADRRAVAAMVYLGMLPGGLGYALWSFAISELGPSRCAMLLYGTPVVSFLAAWAVFGQVPTVATLLGGGLTVGGVVLVNGARTWAARRAT